MSKLRLADTDELHGATIDNGGAVYNVKHARFGAVGDGVADDSQAILDAAATGTTVVIPKGTYRIASNLSIHDPIRMEKGAILRPDSGVTVTITGSFEAGMYQVFDISAGGTVRVRRVPAAYPQWWGAAGDGISDDRAALFALDTSAREDGVRAHLPPGIYRLGSNLKLTAEWEIASGAVIVPDSGVELRAGSGSRITASAEWLDTSAGGVEAFESGSLLYRIRDVAGDPFAAPNICVGFPGNEIDPAVGACVVMQGTQSFPHSVAAGADLSVVAGSYDNHIHENAIASTISGGAHHHIFGSHGTICGGASQTVSGSYAVAVAGQLNKNHSSFGFIGAGAENIVGVDGAELDNRHAVVVGGYLNKATSIQSAVVGGLTNEATANHAFVGGGQLNTATAHHATVSGGLSNQATGDHATVAGGQLGVASGANAAVAGGVSCVASGPYAFAVGQNNTASGPYSVATGARSIADKYGQRSHASGNFAAFGDAQISELVARRETTTATTAPLGLFGGNQPITLPDNTTWAFNIMVVARRTDQHGESAAYEFKGCIDRGVGAATTALVGTVTKTVIAEDSAAWDANVVADTTNGALQINVTSEEGKTIRWVARIELTEVSG